MIVTQRPRATEFCSTMQDYIIDTDATISFAIQYGGQTILEEEYVPDGNNQVRIRNLGQFCDDALWGVWCAGESSWQLNASGTFTFLINGAVDTASYVMFSRLTTKKTASTPGWLSDVTKKVTRPGAFEYLSAQFSSGDNVTLKVYGSDGESNSFTFFTAQSAGVATIDVSPSKVLPKVAYVPIRYELHLGNSVFTFYYDSAIYPDVWFFRYKNIYDMPETLSAIGGLSLSGNNDSSIGSMYGVNRKFSVDVTDEYTANSGRIVLQGDYLLWHSLVNAQEVDINIDGSWYAIIITKQKYDRDFSRGVLKAVEFSFNFADSKNNNLIEL